jgi:hypothetical protein
LKSRNTIWIITLLVGIAVQASGQVEYYFGFSLSTGAHSALYSCFTVKVFKGEVIGVEGLTGESFIKQATGITESRANPDSIDFFEEYRVTSCMKMKDPETGRIRRPCDPFGQLWKLRYSKFPFHSREAIDRGEGWSKNEFKPSPGQLAILSDYGITHTTGMCYGESAFRLLRDINDPLWVQKYQSAE